MVVRDWNLSRADYSQVAHVAGLEGRRNHGCQRAPHAPGRPLSSTAPRKPPRKIAPAKLAAKVRVKVAWAKEETQTKKRRAYSAAVIQHLESSAAAQ